MISNASASPSVHLFPEQPPAQSGRYFARLQNPISEKTSYMIPPVSSSWTEWLGFCSQTVQTAKETLNTSCTEALDHAYVLCAQEYWPFPKPWGVHVGPFSSCWALFVLGVVVGFWLLAVLQFLTYVAVKVGL